MRPVLAGGPEINRKHSPKDEAFLNLSIDDILQYSEF
jgi:hypothetical protein